ncbi:lactate racemase domain-containing protein [soil metagenome]
MASVQTSSPLDVFSQTALPRWARFRQHLNDEAVDSIHEAIAREFANPDIGNAIEPGSRVVLTAGSRGIDRIAEVLKAAVEQVRARGGEPFVIPAMGSHGGATPEGQRALIEHYGVTEQFLGCPIRASMETVLLGTIDGGVPVYFDRIAHEEADVVIPIGRVKPHTDFRGPVESGLAKMIAIGLGKQHGASWFHSQGIGTFGELVPRVAAHTLSQVSIPFGIALVENGLSKLSIVEAVPAAGMFKREAELLEIAKAKLARLPRIEQADVLIVDKIGKDISGDGADPNAINRDVAGEIDFSEALPKIQRYIVRELTSDTDGNATGIGMFDFALRRAVDEMDPIPTYMNMITAKSPSGARIPITVDTDRQALQLAIASALRVEGGKAGIIRIESTKSLEHILASEPLVEALLATGTVEQVSDFEQIAFDPDGMFATAP